MLDKVSVDDRVKTRLGVKGGWFQNRGWRRILERVHAIFDVI